MTKRGRPSGRMTQRRQQVLAAYVEQAEDGEVVNFSRLARRCGIYSATDARRIVKDLRKLGALSN